MKPRYTAPLVLLVLLGVPGQLAADGAHLVDPAFIESTVAQHAAQRTADSAAIHDALHNAGVQTIARQMGLDLRKIDASVDTLSSPQLAGLASLARQADTPQVGGSTVIIVSTSAIVIGLLVLLLILLL